MKNINNYIKSILLAFAIFLLNINDSFAHFGERSPNGGNITVFAIDPTYNVIYLGTKNGGTYYMAANTATGWSRRNTAGIASGNITAITSVGNTTTGLYIIAGTSDAGIFVSSDRGATWTSTTAGLANKNVTALATSGSVVIAGTNGGGIFVSNSNGGSFTAATTQPSSLFITALAVDGSILYAGTGDKGVFKSTDNGVTWTDANASILSTIGISSLAVSGTTLVAGSKNGIYLATTTSLNWLTANVGLTNTTITGLTADGSTWYAGTSGGVFTTTDSGSNWSPVDVGFSGAVQALIFQDNSLYVGTATDGVYKKTLNSTATGAQFNIGLFNVNTYAVYNSAALVVVANENGVYVSTLAGSPATSYVAASGITDSKNVNAFAASGSRLYAATTNNGVFETSDNGFTWTSASTGLPAGISVKKIMATNTKLIAALSSGSIYSSPLSAINWTLGTGTGLYLPTGLASDGTNAFVSYYNDGVYISTDGNEWKPFKEGLGSVNITSIAVQSTNVYVGTPGNGIYKSSSLCPSWAVLNSTLPSQNITSIGAAGKWLVAGYKGGVTASINNGTNWESPTNLWIPDFGNVTAISMSAALSTDRIYVVVPSNAVFSNATSELNGYETTAGANLIAVNTVVSSCIVSGIEEEVATQLLIAPNPSNGSFTISLSNTDASLKSVSLINSYGAVVAQIIAKENKVSISGTYAPGIYFTKITTSKGSISRKVVIE